MSYRLTEKEVQQAVFRYLEGLGSHPSLGGAGPDIKLGGGRGVEVKGGRLRGKSLERAIKQLVEYAHDWSDIEYALPTTALTLRMIYTLYVIEDSLKYRGLQAKTIPVYLVAKTSEKEYGVLQFSSMKDLFDDITNSVISKSRAVYGEAKMKQIERIAQLYKIDDMIVEYLTEKAESHLGRKIRFMEST